MKNIGKAIGNRILGYIIFFGIIFVIGGVYNGGKYLVDQFKNHEKAVFFVNFYDEEIEISVNGEMKTLDGREGYTFYTADKDVKVSAIKGEEELINETYKLDKKAYTIANILDGRESKSDCLFYANISDYFYSSDIVKNDAVYKVKNLSTKSFRSKKFDDNLDPKYTLFPGEYVGDKLPDEIDLEDMGLIRGVFPIECRLIDNPEIVQLKILEYLLLDFEGLEEDVE